MDRQGNKKRRLAEPVHSLAPRALLGHSDLVEARLRIYRTGPSLGRLVFFELPELLLSARTAGFLLGSIAWSDRRCLAQTSHEVHRRTARFWDLSTRDRQVVLANIPP